MTIVSYLISVVLSAAIMAGYAIIQQNKKYGSELFKGDVKYGTYLILGALCLIPFVNIVVALIMAMGVFVN